MWGGPSTPMRKAIVEPVFGQTSGMPGIAGVSVFRGLENTPGANGIRVCLTFTNILKLFRYA